MQTVVDCLGRPRRPIHFTSRSLSSNHGPAFSTAKTTATGWEQAWNAVCSIYFTDHVLTGAVVFWRLFAIW
jgi:hypothetical protein